MAGGKPGRGPFPSDKQDQFMVRFPDGMRDRLKEAAAANNRSMNAEIVIRITHTFEVDAVMAREDLHFRLRIPEALKAKVEAAAEANMRSMTSEIVAILDQHFSSRDRTNDEAIEAAISTIRGEISRLLTDK